MAPTGPIWLIPKINYEIRVDGHTTIFWITVDHHHDAALIPNLWIKLIIPCTEQRGRDIEALSIKRELEHLRATGHINTIHHWSLTQQAAHPNLACQFWVMRVRNIILAHITVQPVIQIEIFIIHRDKNS